MNELFVGMIIGAIGFGVLAAIVRNQDRNSTLKLSGSSRKLIDISDDDGFFPDTEYVMGLVRSGNKLEAIKIVRKMTGLDLKASKDLVDKMSRGIPVDLQPENRQDGAT